MSINLVFDYSEQGGPQLFLKGDGIRSDADKKKFELLTNILTEQGPTCLGHKSVFKDQHAFHVWLIRTHHVGDGEGSQPANGDASLKQLLSAGWTVKEYHLKADGSKDVEVTLNRGGIDRKVTLSKGMDCHAPIVDGIYLTLYAARKLFPNFKLNFSTSESSQVMIEFLAGPMDPAESNSDDTDPTYTHLAKLGPVLKKVGSNPVQASLLKRNELQASRPLVEKKQVNQYDGNALYKGLKSIRAQLCEKPVWKIKKRKVGDFLGFYTPLQEMVANCKARIKGPGQKPAAVRKSVTHRLTPHKAPYKLSYEAPRKVSATAKQPRRRQMPLIELSDDYTPAPVPVYRRITAFFGGVFKAISQPFRWAWNRIKGVFR